MKEPLVTVDVPWACPDPEACKFVPCPLCGQFTYNVVAFLLINAVKFFIVQCSQCRLMWRNPIPDSGFLADLYREEYYEVRKYPRALFDQVGIADAADTDHLARRQRAQQEVTDWKRRGYHPKRKDDGSSDLLEIGGGRGYLQRAAQEAGWTTIALELSPHCIKEAIARGLNVMPIVLDEFCRKYLPVGKTFDLVVFFDLLEHVADPASVMRRVRGILADDGVTILRVPCITEDEVPKYHLVDHIWHFTENTMEALLEQEGFVVAEKHPSGRFPGDDGQIQNVTYFVRKT